MQPRVVFALALATAAIARPQESAPDLDPAESSWPSFHGRFGRGRAEGHRTRVEWDVGTGDHIAWTTEIPGLSHASPVVFGDRVFVNTAVRKDGGDEPLKVGLYGDIASVEDESAYELRLLCVSRTDGAVLWSRTAWTGVPAVKRHPKSSHAASTPATDGEYVATFYGTEGLYVFTVDGELVWEQEFGLLDSGFFRVPTAQWGFASSPVIHDGRVYVQCDVQKDSFVAAFDVETGEEIWRTERDDVPAWSTPTVHVTDARRQLVVNGWKHGGGYDLDTGAELWRIASSGDIPVPTPVAAHGLLFLTSAHGGPARILAIAEDVEGELELEADGERLVWMNRRFGAYMQTPIVYGDELYVCRDNGVITCWNARTGENHYRSRLSAGVGYSASGVAADGKLYYVSEEGDVHVVRAGTEFELLAINPLGETCMASPAVSQGMLLFRGRTTLVAISPP